MPGAVRLGFASQAGALGGDRDRSPRYGRSGFITDIPGKTTARLAVHCRTDGKQESEGNNKKEALEEILFVKPSAKFRHSALMIMRLITNPFQLLRLKAVLACGRRLQLIEQCTTQATKFSEELNEFEIRRSAPRRQRKVCGST
ncbi:hypothetical protein [Tunturiibacter gelidiferens]|uniref:hypothetical protein n=1 Tax=Tunturiibacter gelidiferens TaxID=3069689 RepID=UPI003D9B12FC